MFVGAASVPVAVLLAISGRLDSAIPTASVIGGGTIGPIVAAVSHAVVFGFAYLFFLGFAEEAVELLEAFRLDPALVDAAGSPWTIMFFLELVLVAPLTEETGKALGGWVSRPATRRDAFMAGVAAGVGFAIVENILYASGGFLFGPGWEATVAVRTFGAAVHPLASGLVVMGWWEWKHKGDVGLLFRRFFTGAGVHALWNGSIVVLGIVESAYQMDSPIGLGAVGIAYSAALGAVALAALWRVASSVATGGRASVSFDGTDPRTIGGWVVLTASMLIPMALLFLAYPQLVGGG
jgi:RsiW-degrading membrane proteinase PrsW (M82 family)